MFDNSENENRETVEKFAFNMNPTTESQIAVRQRFHDLRNFDAVFDLIFTNKLRQQK